MVGKVVQGILGAVVVVALISMLSGMNGSGGNVVTDFITAIFQAGKNLGNALSNLRF